jgi:exodeoxyribonuclease V gamma subunit
VSVPFADVRVLLTTWLDETTGRQPLRTGAITATSMVPLRSVPFKVICVMGYDDGTVAAGEADGDDLVGRQQLVGDVDPRVDVRRGLLDCVVAAGERLVITCNGRNARSNKRVPLVTPLAELVDFAVRHGVHRDALDALSGIEIDHPRHHLSRRNFEERGVERAGCWSHDGIAREVLATIESNRRRQQESTAGQTAQQDAAAVRPRSTGAAAIAEAATARAALELTDLSLLERLVKDPLGLYLQETLDINAWRDEDEPTPATLPLSLP